MYIRITSLLFVLIFTLPGRAQQAMSLAQCIDYAAANHTEVRLAQLNVKDAEWQIKENRAIAYPQLQLGLTAQHFIQQPALPAEALGFGEPGQRLTFALRNSLGGRVAFQQLLFNNSYLASVKAARMYRDYAKLLLASTQEKLRNQVTDAYLPALLLTESVAVLEQNIENQEKLFRETTSIQRAGFAEQLDVDRLDYVLSTLRVERERLLRQRDILIDALKFTMGMPLSEVLIPSDDMDQLLVLYGDINPDEELNYMSRPDYLTLLKARELSEVQVTAYRREWFPTLSFFASYDPGWQGNDKLFWIPSAIAGLQVSMPLFDGGMTRAKRERAVLQSLQVEEQKQMLVRALDLEMNTARNQYKSAKQKLADQQRNLDLAQRIHDAAQKKFTAGVGSSFEVTQAQGDYYMAQGSLIQARYEYLNAIVAIKKALGKN